MRQVHTLIIFLLLAAFASCKKETIEHNADYAKSYRTWLSFKDSSNNSYRYMVSQVSWTGYGSETIITVKNGKVVQRSYVRKYGEHNGSTFVITVLDQWTEGQNQLSTHSEGAAAVTLDAVYEKAKHDWLLKRDNAETYFETRNNGMISLCGYRDKNCMDDCLTGITINFIEPI